MHHINFRKVGDGTGRDMYIVKEQVALRGKENFLGMKGTLPFKHLDFRVHDPPPPKTQRAKPSQRRGGKAWPLSLHPQDYRRVMESKEHSPAGLHWAGGAVSMAPKIKVDSSRAVCGFVLEINQALDRLS
ncbi:unnamed protein product [Cladocopium goreaui]|uniref:Uncharacterized protein n=1 Tax=Cladocopium goreaui TaxID=2562237 RepID=A0A9P1FF03_9DINO|nr:unnamed protein product [Cladocopium goreaui]|mmetsp:Transcript_38090/g.81965  ORF Transcript_38090/g.81965 Transcript_38090/m.81965 type:complete len:130 (+) Transcript_38090:80-469(+)